MRLRAFVTAIAFVTTVAMAAPLPTLATDQAPSCVGDCDTSGAVTIEELVTLVSVALGESTSACSATADLNGDHKIAVDELIVALNQALHGCYELGSCDDPAVAAGEPLCALDHQEYPCDFLDDAQCLLPFPSSVFLKADPNTPTGLRLNFPRQGMPVNGRGVHIDPTDWNIFDGYTPGPVIMTYFAEGVDLDASGVARITSFERGLDEDSPVVIIDAATGERIPHMVELDMEAPDPTKVVLMIRPGLRLQNAHRYIVAIRHLVAKDGSAIQARRPFQILRDQLATPVRAIEARRATFEDIFSKLSAAGVARQDLILAWDFTTASTEALTGRMISARDQAIAANGPGAPPFTVTSVEEFTPEQDANILRRVSGTFTVPLFMNQANPPARYVLDANGMPKQNGTADYTFTVNIPRSTVAGGVAHPARPSLYGHGLFGGQDEVNAGHLRAFSNEVNIMFGATDWIGMADPDVRYVLRMIPDLSGFGMIPDRLQQALLNFIFLGRLFIADNGFVTHAAFQLDGQPLIDRQELYYYGLSQGSIAGATLLAVEPDVRRGVLGVGASNYSFLLQRSTDFGPFQAVLNLNYFGAFDRALLYPIMQQLWDRGEPQGYQPHLIENPLPGTSAKKVLFQVGVNDSQVSYIAAEIQARSLGIPTIDPPAFDLFGIPALTPPFDGSAFVEYDVNGAAAPLTNTPPPHDNGVHEAIRRLHVAQQQIDAFLRPDGRVESFCGGPCRFVNVPNVDTEY